MKYHLLTVEYNSRQYSKLICSCKLLFHCNPTQKPFTSAISSSPKLSINIDSNHNICLSRSTIPPTTSCASIHSRLKRCSKTFLLMTWFRNAWIFWRSPTNTRSRICVLFYTLILEEPRPKTVCKC